MLELEPRFLTSRFCLALEPEELGAKMLFLIRGRQDAGMLNLSADEANGGISHRQTEPTASQSAL